MASAASSLWFFGECRPCAQHGFQKKVPLPRVLPFSRGRLVYVFRADLCWASGGSVSDACACFLFVEFDLWKRSAMRLSTQNGKMTYQRNTRNTRDSPTPCVIQTHSLMTLIALTTCTNSSSKTGPSHRITPRVDIQKQGKNGSIALDHTACGHPEIA